MRRITPITRVAPASAALLAAALLLGCGSSRRADSPSVQHSADGPRINPADLDTLTGAPWSGTLTYLDYTSGKQTTIRSTLKVDRKPGHSPAWTFSIGYNDEPHADSSEAVRLSEDGRRLGDELVIDAASLPGGRVRFTTESAGEDNRKPATLRHIYTITPSEFSIRKLVRHVDGSTATASPPAAEFFERHIYRWRR